MALSHLTCFVLLISAIDIDLVRIYHPDSPVSRALPPELTDGRFQAITKAYDALRGKTVMTPAGVEAKADVPQSAAWRRHRARRLDLDSGGDDRWKERLLILGAVFVRLSHCLIDFKANHGSALDRWRFRFPSIIHASEGHSSDAAIPIYIQGKAHSKERRPRSRCFKLRREEVTLRYSSYLMDMVCDSF